MQIQISLLLQKPNDLDLEAKTGHVMFSKRRVNINGLTKHDSHTNTDTRMTITSLSVLLVLITLTAADKIFYFFLYFSEKIGLDISGEISD